MVSNNIINIYSNDIEKSDYEYIQNLVVKTIINNQKFY